ncbi:FtsX-like permease family protein [Roseivirga pacifica]|uniref:FtsX-like permease family protein n=1 Tax=Roseivirga pacifica TaxID=1267423 RepID=UPI003BAF8B43
MFRTYITTFFRKFRKERLFSLLNLGGLTFGLTTVLLITLFIRYELSFDRFHEQKEDIYLSWHLMGRNKVKSDRMAYGLAKQIADEVPEVRKLASFQSRNRLVTAGGQTFLDNDMAYVNSDFLSVFDFPLIYGVAEADNQSVLVSQTMAEKYFGDATLALGKAITVDEKDEYVISGVLKNVPSNSTLQFDFLSIENQLFDKRSKLMDNEAGYFPAQNWFLMQNGFDKATVQEKMQAIAMSMPYSQRYSNTATDQNIFLLPLTDYHLKADLDFTSSDTSDIRYVYLFGAIGFLVLVIAIINYTNLATAQSIKRGKEVGLRKVIGASRSQILSYYLVESFSLVLIGAMLAFALTERLLPWVNNVLQKEMVLNYFSAEFFVLVFGTTALVGFLSGVYPALVLSKAKPLHALGQGKIGSKSKLRKGLTVVQFFIAQLLIIATVIIQQQLSFIQTKNLGYDKELLLEVDLHDKMDGKAQVFKNELLSVSGIESVSMANSSISYADFGILNKDELGVEEEKEVLTDFFNGDEDFLKTLGMEFVSGQFPTKSAQGIVVNESALAAFGWEGKNDPTLLLGGAKLPLIGVVKDFHNESLKSEIRPSVIYFNGNASKFALVRLTGTEVKETVAQITEKWDAMETGRPMQYKFLDEAYNSQYSVEQRLGEMFLFFSGLAIFIAILGIVGLSTFTIEQRIKEISLRRVLGANYREIFHLFARSYIGMILLGFALAAPVVYYFISDWLAQFVYRIEPGVFSFSSAVIATLVISLSVIVLQIGRTRRINPSEILRNE